MIDSMFDSTTNDHSDALDQRAVDAARFVHDGTVDCIDEAIGRLPQGQRPSVPRVRRHLHAMQQAERGLGEWWRQRLAALQGVVELIQTVRYVSPEAIVLLSGRTAQGHVDDTAPATARVIGVKAPVLIDALEAHGLRPPEVSSCATVLGSMPVAHIVDRNQRAVDLLILPNVPRVHEQRNLINDTPVSLLTLEGFIQIVEAATLPS
jgi:hypothetical protein